MITRIIANQSFDFSDTLRVLYNLREPFNAKTFHEVLTRLQKNDFDDQITVMYIAHKTATRDACLYTLTSFSEFLLDNLGIVAVGNIATAIVTGLMNNGLSETEKEVLEKKIVEMSVNM